MQLTWHGNSAGAQTQLVPEVTRARGDLWTVQEARIAQPGLLCGSELENLLLLLCR